MADAMVTAMNWLKLCYGAKRALALSLWFGLSPIGLPRLSGVNMSRAHSCVRTKSSVIAT